MDVTYHFSRFCEDCDNLLVTKYNQLLHPDMEPVWEWITARMDAKSDEVTRLENITSAIPEETQEEIDLRVKSRLGEFLDRLEKLPISEEPPSTADNQEEDLQSDQANSRFTTDQVQ